MLILSPCTYLVVRSSFKPTKELRFLKKTNCSRHVDNIFNDKCDVHRYHHPSFMLVMFLSSYSLFQQADAAASLSGVPNLKLVRETFDWFLDQRFGQRSPDSNPIEHISDILSISLNSLQLHPINTIQLSIALSSGKQQATSMNRCYSVQWNLNIIASAFLNFQI